MLAVYIAAGIIAALFLLLLIPLRLRVQYDGKTGPRMTVKYGLFPLYDSARPVKTSSPAEKPKKAGKRKPKKQNPIAAHLGLTGPWNWAGIRGAARNAAKILRALASRLGKLGKHLVVEEIRLIMVAAEEEPDEAAMEYGELCAVLHPALAVAENCLHIRKREVHLACSFCPEDARTELAVTASLKPLWALTFAGSVVRWYLRFQKG